MHELLRTAAAFIAMAGAAEAAGTAIFEQAREAAGGDAWSRVRSIVAEGTIDSQGMKGTYREVVDLATPRFMRREDYGIVRYDQVWSRFDHWRQNNRGGIHALDSDFGQRSALTDEWLAQRQYLEPRDGTVLSGEETRTEGDAIYVVVTATPPLGQPVELWFDASTHLLARTVRRMNLDTETKRYSDYRDVRGLKLPFRVVDGDDPAQAATSVATSYRLNAATRSDLAPPRPGKDWTIAGGRTTVPIRHDGYVTFEASINGHGPFEFILDTGGHDILTPAAAKALGLHGEGAGSSGGSGEGKVSEQYVRVKTLQVGGMTMRHQVFTILPMPYGAVEQDPRPPLAGIIGLELFERFAVRIDYRRLQLTLTPLATYRHSGPGVAIPLFFNDDEPLVKAALGGHRGDFGIDTGNTGSLIVQGRWAEREGLAEELQKGFDTVGFGMGGASHNWASRADFEIAGTKLPRIITRYSNDKAGSFASIVEAGNVGNDILAHFTVEFDYKRGQVWVEPVPGFTAPPFSRAGMSVSKSRADAFEVVTVVAGGPGSEAGFTAGDVITAVDGIPASRISLNQLGRTVRQAPGTRVVFDVLRDGEPASRTLVLRELLP